jgi:hypothetical protein
LIDIVVCKTKTKIKFLAIKTEAFKKVRSKGGQLVFKKDLKILNTVDECKKKNK